jgi:hypothetical protein
MKEGQAMKAKQFGLSAVVVIFAAFGLVASVNHQPIIPNLSAPTSVSMVAANGDQNPYGVAFVPVSFVTGGLLNPRDIIVSDFNDNTNTQGTGTTIVRVLPTGQTSVFFQGSANPGLTTALGVLSAGFVLVGNLPNMNGVAQQGALQVIDRFGNTVETLTDSKL